MKLQVTQGSSSKIPVGFEGAFFEDAVRDFQVLFCATFPAKSQKHVFGYFNGFPTASHGLSVNFRRFRSVSVGFSHFQTFSITFNHLRSLQSLSITLTQSKRRKLLTMERWGIKTQIMGALLLYSMNRAKSWRRACPWPLQFRAFEVPTSKAPSLKGP